MRGDNPLKLVRYFPGQQRQRGIDPQEYSSHESGTKGAPNPQPLVYLHKYNLNKLKNIQVCFKCIIRAHIVHVPILH
jgi:hypothetical protein